MALWGGRFESGPEALFREINDSLPFDYLMAREDIYGSIGWAKAIHRAGVLTSQELELLLGGLRALDARVAADPGLARRSESDEDIHSWVERELVGALGALGKKLHTGRSRNDQVATDLRLWVRARIDERLAELRGARGSLIALAEREVDTVIPGYTHLQRAQPVLLSHWALAYEAMLARDTERFLAARERVNILPLGSGALAGTAYAVDRDALARDLGFSAPSSNSLDAVSDRDFVIETLSAAAICGVHLSRLGEDLILYGTQEFGFFEFADGVSSGSSLMPQKKNPDAAELLRGKSGRLIGSLVTLLTVVKGLPLAYNKDLQEDKEPIFDAMASLSLSLRIVPRILDTVKVRRDRCLAAARGGYSNATDLADYLVARGVPFREAHEQVGRCVRRAIELDLALDDMPLDEMKRLAPLVAADVFPALRIEAGLGKRDLPGGTGANAVRAAIGAARARLGP